MEYHADSDHTDPRRIKRAYWIVGLLVAGTLAALILSFAHPEATVWHFLGVTQLLPLFYLVLSVWAAWPLDNEDPG